MKVQINLTDSQYDLERFQSVQDLKDLLKGFDGIELMHFENAGNPNSDAAKEVGNSISDASEDTGSLISDEMVVGYHITQPEYWLDFWRGRLDLCAKEFDTVEKAASYYGGTDPSALVRKIRAEYNNAISRKAEYMVIHVSDAGIMEEITGTYHYQDRDVIRGFCELVNEALPNDANGPLVLLENLWQPGLSFRDPHITAKLLEGVNYPRKGLMLDTGHLMHTEPTLRTQKDAVAFIHRRLDEHGSLCSYIKGIHLNQSMTGKIMERYRLHPPVPAPTYEERTAQLFEYIFQVDLHRPFVGAGVRELVERIDPDYLTFEFISRNLAEHRSMLKRQQRVFRN